MKTTVFLVSVISPPPCPLVRYNPGHVIYSEFLFLPSGTEEIDYTKSNRQARLSTISGPELIAYDTDPPRLAPASLPPISGQTDNGTQRFESQPFESDQQRLVARQSESEGVENMNSAFSDEARDRNSISVGVFPIEQAPVMI